MAFGDVTLIPGINVERTPTLLRAGFTASSLIRFKDALVQKLGGWVQYFNLVIAGVPRDLHVWEDLRGDTHLFIGTTVGAFVLTDGISLSNLTPQIFTSDFAPNFNTTAGSNVVTVTDPNIANLTLFDSVFFNTPVSVGGLILSGMYQVTSAIGGHVYEINAATNATATVNGGGVVPVFTTALSSIIVAVNLPSHGLSVNQFVTFQIPTSGNGITINENYIVTGVLDVNDFNIASSNQATAAGSFPMNNGNAELVYYIAQGPPAVGSGYGGPGGYGLGGYGLGVGSAVTETGSSIAATDWTSANWGEIGLFCPAGGGIYQWDPTAGFATAILVSSAPTFCGGIFVSTSEQILIAWGSSFIQGFGVQADPLFVQWSTVGDYTNWTPTAQDQAGGFRIPIGSKIMGGMATPTQNIIWTDLDCWAMNYLGPPFVFGFNQIGAGAGMISSHAAIQLRGQVYWMGFSNFYQLTAQGVAVVPCPVWDFVFQNLNTAFQQNVRAMPNTNFNEVGWLFPSNNSANGENDCYVKFNITEQGMPWDIGPSGALPRSAWIDQTILGPPIGASSAGVLYQHEKGFDAAGQSLQYSFTTGFFYIAEGEDFAFVDQIYPDFKWGFYGQAQTAQVQITILALNYPGDPPQVFGPYTVTQSTQYISTRIRARQMAFLVSGNDHGSFMRLGHVRYRWGAAGRR